MELERHAETVERLLKGRQLDGWEIMVSHSRDLSIEAKGGQLDAFKVACQREAISNRSICDSLSSNVRTPSNSLSWTTLVALAIGAVTPGWAASQARAT